MKQVPQEDPEAAMKTLSAVSVAKKTWAKRGSANQASDTVSKTAQPAVSALDKLEGKGMNASGQQAKQRKRRSSEVEIWNLDAKLAEKKAGVT